MLPLVITRVRDQARAIRSFDLMPESASGHHGVAFVPGQVAVLSVPNEPPAYFAFAGAPEDAELEVLVKQRQAQQCYFRPETSVNGLNWWKSQATVSRLTNRRARIWCSSQWERACRALAVGAETCAKTKKSVWAVGSALKYGARTPMTLFRDETQGWEDAGLSCAGGSRPDGHDCLAQQAMCNRCSNHVLPDLKSQSRLSAVHSR